MACGVVIVDRKKQIPRLDLENIKSNIQSCVRDNRPPIPNLRYPPVIVMATRKGACLIGSFDCAVAAIDARLADCQSPHGIGDRNTNSMIIRFSSAARSVPRSSQPRRNLATGYRDVSPHPFSSGVLQKRAHANNDPMEMRLQKIDISALLHGDVVLEAFRRSPPAGRPKRATTRMKRLIRLSLLLPKHAPVRRRRWRVSARCGPLP